MFIKSMIVLGGAALLLTLSCAPGPNQLVDVPDESGNVAGFWLGLWHGFIVLFTFLISLFQDDIRIYEVHNSGALYNLGFILGLLIFFGGGGGETGRRSRRRRD